MKCRHCASTVETLFVDLGAAPPSNAYLSAENLNEPEARYPLQVYVCEKCWLVQTKDFAKRDEFFSENYAYFSSASTSWLDHSRRFVADMISRFDLEPDDRMVEIASNDGYLLQYAKAAGLQCYGIEPTGSTAEAARNKGIDVVEEFFGEELAKRLALENRKANITVANNVLAHVPDINDFVRGFATLLVDDGVATFEFPHLLQLVQQHQFDTIYHEHYSYLSLTAVKTIFEFNGLSIFDVEELPTHGGSLRVFAQRADTGIRIVESNVATLLRVEQDAGMTNAAFYSGFQDHVLRIRDGLLNYLENCRTSGLRVAAYGAAAKGNTLLNFAGVASDMIECVADKSESKQGLYMPGSKIPIVSPEELLPSRPDRILILPWNLKSEIVAQLTEVGDWNCKFLVAIPEVVEFDPQERFA